MLVTYANPQNDTERESNKKALMETLYYVFFESGYNTDWLQKAINEDIHTWNMLFSKIEPDRSIALDKVEKRAL